MAGTVRDVMTPDPVTVDAESTCLEAAQLMRDRDVGDVLVVDSEHHFNGILTDRDIVVRGVAEGNDPSVLKVRRVCSTDIVALRADDEIDDAVELMRLRAVRRLPVLDGWKPVGIVSIGDLAMERDPHSALANISAAAPTS
jgi:CBS domain-containing protein